MADKRAVGTPRKDNTGEKETVYTLRPELKQNLFNVVNITGARSQNEISERIGIKPATFNRYVRGETEISLMALQKLCATYKIPLEDMLLSDVMEKRKNRQALEALEFEHIPLEEYENYTGTYYMYADSAGSVQPQYGVMRIYSKGPEGEKAAYSDSCNVIMLSKLTYKEALECKEEFSGKDIETLGREHKKAIQFYEGSVRITQKFIFIAMVSKYYDDTMLITLPNMRKKRQYIGGIGIANGANFSTNTSLSPGAKKIILSRYDLSAYGRERIRDELGMELSVSDGALPSEDWLLFSRKVLRLATELIAEGAGGNLPLSQEDIELILAKNAQIYADEVLRSHRLRQLEISAENEKRVYRMIRNSENTVSDISTKNLEDDSDETDLD